jgi:hypothetical protein
MGVFGALAVFLMHEVARSDGPAVCSACGQPHWPERRPNPNRRTYCADCRGWADHRDATRDDRARRRARG